jgi:two-component system phosphate regulon sensor histidine kinase PhoR
MNRATTAALETGHTSIREERGGRSYQLDISRIESAGKVMGLVILAFDVSEREYAERTRREFSANVSHELKTPLTSIIASADLIENNLVKPEDMSRFIGHIRKEASRLLTLIEDIIRLSQLDEGVEMPTEAVDLSIVASEAVEQLRDTADNSNVQIALRTENCILQGVPRLLHEIVYNLVENAIKYNVPEGSVLLRLYGREEQVRLSVEDTGIGIPEADRPYIFDRFYRVDKARSREAGGSGLGLSIVHDAVLAQGGSITVGQNKPQGSIFMLSFPRPSAEETGI